MVKAPSQDKSAGRLVGNNNKRNIRGETETHRRPRTKIKMEIVIIIISSESEAYITVNERKKRYSKRKGGNQNRPKKSSSGSVPEEDEKGMRSRKGSEKGDEGGSGRRLGSMPTSPRRSSES
jgi:hypothetical protein